MIDIRDLTIGNWVFDGNHTKFPMQITSLSEDYVTMSFPSNEGMDWESKPEDLRGIPITKEILLYSGFRFDGFKEDLIKEYDVFVFRGEIRFELKYSKGGFRIYINGFNEESKPIFFLHELQNLFWNITKQQLNIKL
jgi:hypothetical protein